MVRRARVRVRARRHPGDGRFRRGDHRRVHTAGARRRARGDRLARGRSMVLGCGRHGRHLVGRVQRTAGRRLAAAGAEGRHQPVLHRRSLRRRRALQGRLRTGMRRPRLGVGDALLQRAASGSRNRWRGLEGDLAWHVSRRRRRSSPSGSAPTSRRLLEARLDLRGLRRDRVPRVHGGRVGRRVHERDPTNACRAGQRPQGAHRALGPRVAARRPTQGPAHRLPGRGASLVGSVAQGKPNGTEHEPMLQAWMQEPAERGRAPPRSAGPVGVGASVAGSIGERPALPPRRRRLALGSAVRRRSAASHRSAAPRFARRHLVPTARKSTSHWIKGTRTRSVSRSTRLRCTSAWSCSGHPRLRLTLSVDRPQAFVVARLCRVAPDGSSTSLSRGALESDPPERPRTAGGARARHAVRSRDRARCSRPGRRGWRPVAPRDLDDVLAVAVAFARGGGAHRGRR